MQKVSIDQKERWAAARIKEKDGQSGLRKDSLEQTEDSVSRRVTIGVHLSHAAREKREERDFPEMS